MSSAMPGTQQALCGCPLKEPRTAQGMKRAPFNKNPFHSDSLYQVMVLIHPLKGINKPILNNALVAARSKYSIYSNFFRNETSLSPGHLSVGFSDSPGSLNGQSYHPSLDSDAVNQDSAQ